MRTYSYDTSRQGPSEFNVTGPLRHWNIIPELHKIKVSTLLLNGRYDETSDVVVTLLFKHIPHVRWYTFADSSHLPYWEERDLYMKRVSDFLAED
jgi:pimeloyl-ACP methyl ester carboxylesterase